MNFIAPLLCGDIHVAHWQGPSPNSKKENLLSTIMKGSSYRYIQEKETLPHKQTREKSFIIVADQEVPVSDGRIRCSRSSYSLKLTPNAE